MTKLVLELKKQTVGLGEHAIEVPIPYWFTIDQQIYMNEAKPTVELDLDTLFPENALAVHNAYLEGQIDVKEGLESLYAKISGIPDSYMHNETLYETIKEPLQAHDINKLKSIIVQDKANKILAGNVKQVQEFIDHDATNDIYLLVTLVELENKQPQPRKTILTNIQNKINNIIKNGITIAASDLEELEVTDTSEIVVEHDELAGTKIAPAETVKTAATA